MDTRGIVLRRRVVRRTLFTFFFLNDTAPPEIYTLPLHAALPILAAIACQFSGRRQERKRLAEVCGRARHIAFTRLGRSYKHEHNACIYRIISAAIGHGTGPSARSEEHTSELQSQSNLVCRLLLET